jgi:HEAT repeat protein
VKNRVLNILGIKKNPHSLSRIESILTDPNVEVRRTAALTLGQIGGKEALALLARMTKDTNPFVRKAAEKALQETSDLRFT